MSAQSDETKGAAAAAAVAAPAAVQSDSAPSTAAATDGTTASVPSASASTSGASATAAASSPAAAAPAAAAAAAKPKKQWSAADIAEVPEGADPLDYINMEKLKEDNASLPTTQEGIASFLNTMPITADQRPTRKEDMNREFAGIQELIDETPVNTRAENFKDSGNEAYKLSQAMKKEWTEKTAKREAAAKARKEAGLPEPVLTAQEAKDEAYELNHLKKLHEGISKRMQDSVIYYTQALDTEKEQAGEQLTKHLKSQILANRALVHMALQNYGRAQDDCDEALKLIPSHPKACYRGAQACLAVHPPKLEKARKYITAGKVVGPDAEKRKAIDWQFRAEQKSLAELEAKVVAIEQANAAKEAKKKEAALASQTASQLYAAGLAAALQSRGLKLGPLVFDFARSAYAEQSKEGPGHLPRPLLTPAPTPAKPYSSSTTRLSWPLLFLYPDVLQSDFLQECQEGQTLADHLAHMFPPGTDYAPWDEKRRYTLDNLSVWIDTRGPNVPADSTPEQDAAARVLVNPRQTLGAILANPKLAKKGYVIPGIPTFIVLPKQ